MLIKVPYKKFSDLLLIFFIWVFSIKFYVKLVDDLSRRGLKTNFKKSKKIEKIWSM